MNNRTNRSAANKFGYSLIWIVCWVFCRVWFGLRYVGRTNVPARGPVLVLSNHQSYLDPIILGVASLRPLRALARRQLFFWPLSWIIRLLGAVPVDRERSALGGIKAVLDNAAEAAGGGVLRGLGWLAASAVVIGGGYLAYRHFSQRQKGQTS